MKRRPIWLAGAIIPLLASPARGADDPVADLQAYSAKPTMVVAQSSSTTIVAPPADATVFAKDRLEQLVGPIALYPDALLAQILMASTYPLQVVQAARWRDKNSSLKDAALDTAAKNFEWDPSVKSLLHFPDLLKRMSDNLDWTQDLGDAMLAQQEDVMAAVQRLRRAAYDAGNLQTSQQQKVVVEETVIRVEPATEVVYVPSYNPTVVYGSYWSYPSYYYPIYSYPPSYWYPPGYGYGAGLIGFGLGMAWGAAIWGDCDWHGGYVGHHGDIDINRNTNINIDRNKMNRWEHNSNNRKGVRYNDNKVANRYNQGNRAQTQPARGGVDRDTARGYDRGQGAGDRAGAGNRPATQPSGGRTGDRAGAGNRPATQPAGDRTGDRAGAGDRPSAGTSDRQAGRSQGASQPRASTRDYSSSGRNYSGSAYNRGSGSFDSAASYRGASSRGTTSYGGGSRSYGGGSRSGFSGGGSRGGGGGRGGGGRR